LTASRYLATHASPVDNPYARLAVPSYSGCTRINYKLETQRTETVSPGVYCDGIEVVSGATLNLEPGAYSGQRKFRGQRQRHRQWSRGDHHPDQPQQVELRHG
jgi:hypothetical protein